MTSRSFDVDISPEMQLYKILQRQSYGLDTALAEFIDNSIQSFLDKKDALKKADGSDHKLLVTITIDSTSKEINIEDNAGGIRRSDFQRAIRMGHGEGFFHHGESLSVYGIGMKSAAIWLSDTWTIETSAISSSEKLVTKFDLNELLVTGKSKITVKPATANKKEHYTRITITNSLRELDNQEDYLRDEVLPYLRETFVKFKDFLSISIIYDGLVLDTEKAFLDIPESLFYPVVDRKGEAVSDKQIRWRKNININYAGRKVKGFILIMKKGGYSQPGIRLLRNKRVIKGTQGGDRQNKPKDLLGTTNKYAAQRIYGELHLDKFAVNFMKTDFDENLNGLYRLIQTELKGDESKGKPDYVQQAESYRVRKAKSTTTTSGGGKSSGDVGKTGSKSNTSGATQSGTVDQIEFSDSLHKLLQQLSSKKQARLYHSLCNISLTGHAILAYVGAWTLLESLSGLLGNDTENHAFDGFYMRLINTMYGKRSPERKAYRESIEDIHKKGNLNKHSGRYEVINAQQLVSDFNTLEPFIIDCLQDYLSNK